MSKFFLMGFALFFRIVLIFLVKIIDEGPSPKKYTDTDYHVFTDAA